MRTVNAIDEAGAYEQTVDFGWVWVEWYASLPRCNGEQLLEFGKGTVAG